MLVANEIRRGMLVFFEDRNDILLEGVQGKKRPFLVVSNNKFNQYSPVINRIPLTTKEKKFSPVHILLKPEFAVGLQHDSILLCEQISTIPKNMCRIIGELYNSDILKLVDTKIAFQLGMSIS